jgi:hypothetical protein
MIISVNKIKTVATMRLINPARGTEPPLENLYEVEELSCASAWPGWAGIFGDDHCNVTLADMAEQGMYTAEDIGLVSEVA